MMSGQPGWREALLPVRSNVRDAIECLNRSALQIVLLVDENERLLGTITDGDIRRALLRGVNLEAGLVTIAQRQPFVVPDHLMRDAVIRIMKLNRVQQVPIVNDAGCVVGLHLWNELSENATRDNVMVVMAGGIGSRLKPYTDACPKPLVPVNGKPMLEHIVNRAKDNGIRKFVFTIRYLGEMIVDYFGDGGDWGISIEYIREQEPLGTAGGLAYLAPVPEGPFIVTNGDVLTDIDYGQLLDFHVRHEAIATVAIREYEWQHPYGVIRTDGVHITEIEEKPVLRTYVNAGVYALDPSVLQTIKKGTSCDMPDLLTRLQTLNERLVAYPMHEPWLDVGRPTDLSEARAGRPAMLKGGDEH